VIPEPAVRKGAPEQVSGDCPSVMFAVSVIMVTLESAQAVRNCAAVPTLAVVAPAGLIVTSVATATGAPTTHATTKARMRRDKRVDMSLHPPNRSAGEI
jgi:hypothetical protein